MAFEVDSTAPPTIVNSSVRRTREYLTGAEVEIMAAARKSSRYGHRDATMILIAYRHGLRASEVCDLQWHQVELNAGRLHVRRSKRGTPSVHPIQGDEIRALRRLQREQPPGPHVFTSERGGPMTPKRGTGFGRQHSGVGSAIRRGRRVSTAGLFGFFIGGRRHRALRLLVFYAAPNSTAFRFVAHS